MSIIVFKEEGNANLLSRMPSLSFRVLTVFFCALAREDQLGRVIELPTDVVTLNKDDEPVQLLRLKLVTFQRVHRDVTGYVFEISARVGEAVLVTRFLIPNEDMVQMAVAVMEWAGGDET